MMLRAGAVLAGTAAGLGVLRHTLRSRLLRKPCSLIVSEHQPLACDQDQFSIASYNILCEHFATPERFPNCLTTFLDYSWRWSHLQNQLAGLGADIVCFQEITPTRWDELKEFMHQHGYQGSIVQSKKDHQFFLGIFFNTNKFEMTWSDERSRALIIELQMKGELRQDAVNETHDGEDGCGDDRLAHQALYIINVHLEGHPRRANDRINQIHHALERLERHLQNVHIPFSAAKIIVCGDFNSNFDDGPCQYLRAGYLEAGTRDTIAPDVVLTSKDLTHPFILRDCYELAHAVPPFTRKVNSEGARMDFVFCSPTTLHPVHVLRPLRDDHERDLALKFYLPNKLQPSDHLPIGVVFQNHATRSEHYPRVAAAGEVVTTSR